MSSYIYKISEIRSFELHPNILKKFHFDVKKNLWDLIDEKKMKKPTVIGANVEKYVKDITLILNKISADNYEKLSEEICKLKLTKDKLLTLAHIICEKAFLEVSYRSIYVKLLETFIIVYPDLKMMIMKKVVMCVKTEYKPNLVLTPELKTELDISDYLSKAKTRYIGCLYFIMDLCTKEYLSAKSGDQTIDILFGYCDADFCELNIDYVCEVFQYVLKSRVWCQRKDSIMIAWMKKLLVYSDIWKESGKSSLILYKISIIHDLCHQSIMDIILE